MALFPHPPPPGTRSSPGMCPLTPPHLGQDTRVLEGGAAVGSVVVRGHEEAEGVAAPPDQGQVEVVAVGRPLGRGGRAGGAGGSGGRRGARRPRGALRGSTVGRGPKELQGCGAKVGEEEAEDVGRRDR